jgi:pyruvate-formate lyase-activating enzyme
MLIATHSCDYKCLIEKNLPLDVCQNSHLSMCETKSEEIELLIKRFNDNKLSDCIIFAGLEPMLQFKEILNFIKEFRKKNNEDVIIYTGYYENEVLDKLNILSNYKNIIVKFGRYDASLSSIFDNILNVELISNNQYAKKIS